MTGAPNPASGGVRADLTPARAAWPLSAILLAISGAALVVIGLYFALFRPALLPEDLRYIDRTFEQLAVCAPRLADWLTNVFRVMGGYVLATGALTTMLAATSFRLRQRGAAIAAGIAWLASIGAMTAVNFVIDSNFKWALLGIALLWASSLALFNFEKPSLRQE